MKKTTTTKIAGVALASTMIFGCGSVLAAPAPAVQQVQAEGQTMAAYSTGDLSVNSSETSLKPFVVIVRSMFLLDVGL